MAILEVTFYQVQCDQSGCTFKTGEDGSDYAAWGDTDGAVTDWDDAGHQATDDGRYFCDEHRVPTCCGCDSAKVVFNDNPDGTGDWYCAACEPSD